MELPYGLQRMVGPPPTNLCKAGWEPRQPSAKDAKNTAIKHARGASAAPALVTAGIGPGGGGGISPVKPGYQGRAAGGGQGPPVLPAPKF